MKFAHKSAFSRELEASNSKIFWPFGGYNGAASGSNYILCPF